MDNKPPVSVETREIVNAERRPAASSPPFRAEVPLAELQRVVNEMVGEAREARELNRQDGAYVSVAYFDGKARALDELYNAIVSRPREEAPSGNSGLTSERRVHE